MNNGEIITNKVSVITDPESGLPKIVENPDAYGENHGYWESMIPPLKRFSRVADHMGYDCIYETAPNYPGLVQVRLIDSETNEPYKVLMIDPKIVYGDQVRVITQDNKSGDIRKETYVPLKDNLIEKVITGLSKEDRKSICENLPRVMKDFRGDYNILDRVDLRNISKKPISDNDWRELIINISNILKDKDLPLCRYRIVDYKNPRKFKLYCDENVLSSFLTNIFTEPSHVEAVKDLVWVDYDENKYKDSNGYTHGITSMQS